MKKILIITFTLLLTGKLFAIGTGGLLIHVPYAEIYFDSVKVENCKVYVHPMEGAYLIFPDSGNYAYAFDKVKKQIIKIDKVQIKKTNWDNIVEVPHKAPYEVLAGRPVFSRFYASGVIEDKFVKIEINK